MVRSTKSVLSITGCVASLLAAFLPMVAVDLFFEPAYFILIDGNSFVLGFLLCGAAIAGLITEIYAKKDRLFMIIAAADTVITLIAIFVIITVLERFQGHAVLSFGLIFLLAGPALMIAGIVIKFRKRNLRNSDK